MPKLVCRICGDERDVPKCCDKSMVLGNDYMLCCCNGEACQHQKIPECCDQRMEFVDF